MRFNLAIRAAIIPLLAVLPFAVAQQTSAGKRLHETVFLDGHIYTGGPDAKFVFAMLVREDRIVAVGDLQQVKNLAGAEATVVDLHGKTMLPGLIDTHTHSMDWAITIVRGQIDLRYPKVKSIADVQEKIRERVKTLKPGEWIQGTAWDDSKFAEDRYITRQDIDAVAPNNPVYLEHVTGHLGVANSAALKLAGIDASTKDPSGGLIQHDAAGQPTGIVKDNAMGLVEAVLPVPTHEDWVAAAGYLSKACAEYGLTSIHDVALLAPAMDAYQDALRRGVLKVRVEMAPLVTSEADVDALLYNGVHTGFGNDWLKFGAVKFFSDGGMAARTIAIYPPGPAGDEKNIGLLLWKPQELQKLQLKLAIAGWQISTHAIGDRAIDEVLDSYAKIAAVFPGRDLRNRVIHDGIATPAIQKRLVEEHVYVDNNPPFVYFLGKHFQHYGPERMRWAYPGKSYFDHGIVASGGSDTYVTPLSPWWGIWAAVVRKEQNSGEVLAPEERLTVPQAIQEYTYNGALAGFDEKNKGALEAGKLADFIVIDRDIFTAPVDELKDVKVLSTWIGGQQMFDAEAQP
jgi:predicted amidohydrolase YtcJ